MEWGSWSAFWHMGGYGLYVWGSYFVYFIAFALEIVMLHRGHGETVKRLKRMQKWESQ
jgi:heme exporter protein D